MRLLLVRHGETPSNVHHLLDTAVPGPALTELGEAQAAALPEALAGEVIEAVYASPLLRARLTADRGAAEREQHHQAGGEPGAQGAGAGQPGQTVTQVQAAHLATGFRT